MFFASNVQLGDDFIKLILITRCFGTCVYIKTRARNTYIIFFLDKELAVQLLRHVKFIVHDVKQKNVAAS